MIKFEKTITCPSSGQHTIKSDQVLTEVETGRVVAVFYNDYDLDVVLQLQSQLAEVKAKLAKAEAEADTSWALAPSGSKSK